MDYEQFWLDLDEANAKGIAKWKLEYSFKDFYDAKDFSPEEFERILERMQTEDAFFERYFEANSVQKVDYKCDEVCKAYHICTIAEQDYDRFEVCLKRELPDPTTENTDPTTTDNPDLTTTENPDNGAARLMFNFLILSALISFLL